MALTQLCFQTPALGNIHHRGLDCRPFPYDDPDLHIEPNALAILAHTLILIVVGNGLTCPTRFLIACEPLLFVTGHQHH